MKEKNAIINDKLGGANSLPIKYVRESLWESENPVIKSDIFLIISGCFIFEEFLISCDQGIITGGYFRFRG